MHGMDAYVCSQPGFTGVIKSKWEDFQVWEIDPAGDRVEITTTSIPPHEPVLSGKRAKIENGTAAASNGSGDGSAVVEKDEDEVLNG